MSRAHIGAGGLWREHTVTFGAGKITPVKLDGLIVDLALDGDEGMEESLGDRKVSESFKTDVGPQIYLRAVMTRRKLSTIPKDAG